MIWVLLAMLVILVLAGLVATYVAYPARGQDVPGAPWVGDVLGRGVDALPTLDDDHSSLRP
ncbi:MAG: hypothetical protein QOK15_3104 [Nocardioidaceae bacterium]|nr:hypothetical protein [Nocardioidaceae bacterium]